MREIKFRAWHKEKKIMFDVWSINNRNAVPVVYTHHPFESMPTAYDLRDVEIMQFTGLHDKNGKEIWEGDIVKTDSGMKQLVAWREDYAQFVFRIFNQYGYSIGASCSITSNCEVLGNIYENPELLK